jgi:hypothetical protein
MRFIVSMHILNHVGVKLTPFSSNFSAKYAKMPQNRAYFTKSILDQEMTTKRNSTNGKAFYKSNRYLLS